MSWEFPAVGALCRRLNGLDEGFAAIWLSNGDVPSLELCARAPVPPIEGWSTFKPWTPSAYPVTHLHFAPLMARTVPLAEQIANLFQLVEQHWKEFREYRRLTPFALQVGWHFSDEADVALSSQIMKAFAQLRAFIDFDLYRALDEDYIETVHHDLPFYYGEVTVSVGGAVVRDGIDAARRLGTLIRAAVAVARPGDEIDLDVRGGCGRPTAHFSAHAMGVAAANNSGIRLRVRPNAESRAPRLP